MTVQPLRTIMGCMHVHENKSSREGLREGPSIPLFIYKIVPKEWERSDSGWVGGLTMRSSPGKFASHIHGPLLLALDRSIVRPSLLSVWIGRWRLADLCVSLPSVCIQRRIDRYGAQVTKSMRDLNCSIEILWSLSDRVGPMMVIPNTSLLRDGARNFLPSGSYGD